MPGMSLYDGPKCYTHPVPADVLQMSTQSHNTESENPDLCLRKSKWGMIPDQCSKPTRLVRLTESTSDWMQFLTVPESATRNHTLWYSHLFGGTCISTNKHFLFHKWSIRGARLTSTRECQCAMGFRGYDSISLQWSLPSLSASLPTWHTPMTSLWPTLWKWPTIVFS